MHLLKPDERGWEGCCLISTWRSAGLLCIIERRNSGLSSRFCTIGLPIICCICCGSIPIMPGMPPPGAPCMPSTLGVTAVAHGCNMRIVPSSHRSTNTVLHAVPCWPPSRRLQQPAALSPGRLPTLLANCRHDTQHMFAGIRDCFGQSRWRTHHACRVCCVPTPVPDESAASLTPADREASHLVLPAGRPRTRCSTWSASMPAEGALLAM